MCVCARLEMIYWQRLIIHVSGVFPCCWSRKWRSLHLEAVSQQLTQPSVSLETYFSVSVSNRLSGALHPIMAGWILASSGAQLIWHWLHSGHLSRGTGEEMSLSIHRTDYFTREQKSSKADFHACANVVTGIWIWHELTEYWRSTSLKRCKHFLRYPGVIPSVCIVHFGKIETAVVQILNSSGLKGWTLNCPTLQKLSMLRSFFVHFWDFTGHKKTHKGGKKRKKRAKVICQTVNTSLLKHHVTRWPWTNKPLVARCRRV